MSAQLEHVLDRRLDRCQKLGRQIGKASHQSTVVDGAELIGEKVGISRQIFDGSDAHSQRLDIVDEPGGQWRDNC